MESVITEGKSVEEAVNAGLLKMGLKKEEVEIEVLEEGSKGFLGLVNVKSARVKITKKKVEEPIIENPEQKVTEILDMILRTIDVQYKLDIEKDGKQIRVFIKSMEEGLIIGKRGRNIDAIQHIVNRIMNRGLGEAKFKIVIDTNGRYREKKEKSLREMVSKLSQRVMEIHKPITIIPLNPYERRIVHIAARDIKTVDVESIGEGFYKKMVFKRKIKN
ncbi:MAG: hypothetical protein A2161_07035 [Candidatus Schekmanbacteria bacterium RBG_13_48_7]|uniref:RNA-binding protein KhpB n=1 Tax=Candidatus Schekmanbacteria bacterium RBG_13_48_7 TaxID=1817878 RepID=A0A1F7RQM1_9BACT|nr:MAG: hypothetical protein A2161_07035 [Candidatus Schekmanbacteria bacterium RBG_13_48_7]